MNSAILLISCSDQKGITAAIADFIYKNGGNIEHADQHIDYQTNTFFMRVQWSLGDFKIPGDSIKDSFLPLAENFSMAWSLHFDSDRPRVAIFVSRHTHCLQEILIKHSQNYLPCEIPLIVSNHSDASRNAKEFNIPFYEYSKNPKNKIEVEKKEMELLRREKIELIVLARYSQILTGQFVGAYPNRIINIHHSFLPAFIGSNPYGQAWSRGVKIIGATSHYVTEQLDAGPIIEQDTARVWHRNTLDDLKREGQDLERTVLSRALRLHLERKILTYNNKTVVFD
ncbi:MAG: formyltetrahydrofolate deformylase [Candidatus Omnitrophica bacterium]|nr:formyltetrahydrofolate deformylase [Candidatus Omnitrophota bacterium]MDD5429760.1 formyltetrahydrofolate deformylase [Candidatus Omnitrophota bacterium]